MQQFTIIFVLALMTSLLSCTRDNSTPELENLLCGTVGDMSWAQTVTSDSLVGKWSILGITYSRGSGETHYYDTSYTSGASLTLNANGTGAINSSPLNWSFTHPSHSLPTLTITKLDTLFPFQVNFIYNDSIDLYLQSPPETKSKSGFFVSAGKGVNGQWEQSYINFKRQ
jgi:hypothetical protein